MNKQFILRNLLLVVAFCSLGLLACSEDETESPVTLHFQSVGDIGPGMPYRGSAPTYRGAAPSEFAIESITLDGTAFVDETPCFTLDPNDGFLTISDSKDLQLGTYRFTVSCKAAGARCLFTDAFSVRMVSATPENIVVTPELIEALYDEDRVAWPTAQIAPADEAVSFNAYALVQEKGKEYFSVSSTGEISVNMKYEGTIPPGIYKPVLRLTTKAGSADYADAVTIKVNSQPLGVTYERNPGTAEIGAAFRSDVPVLLGSTDEVDYAILSVSPSTDQFSIDPATGVISLPDGHTLKEHTSYEFSLAVSNKFSNGQAVALRGVYTVDVVPFIAPIDPAKFSYAPATMTEFCKFEIEKAEGFVGDVVTFSLGELPEALKGWVSIDSQTGKITIPRGNEIPQGVYDIPVTAVNSKSDLANPATATLKLTVQENPNMFYKFGYGNNLGLPVETNADQFRWDGDGKTNENKVIPLSGGYNDFNGRKATFKVEVLHDWSLQNAGTTTTVDENGDLHLQMRGNRWGQIGYVRVTATLGEGETAVSRSTIVFTVLRNAKVDLIEYTPFVHRMHPRNGGYSPIVPQIASSVEKDKLVLSYRNNAFYIDLDDYSKAIKIDATGAAQTDEWRASWGYRLWGTYFTSGTVNTGSRMPFSYYGGSDAEFVNKDLARTLGYIDPTRDFQIYISPNKWMLDGKYAHGIFSFQAAYATNGSVDKMHGSSTKIGVVIWFDENF